MALALSPLLALLLVALSGCGRGDTNPHTSGSIAARGQSSTLLRILHPRQIRASPPLGIAPSGQSSMLLRILHSRPNVLRPRVWFWKDRGGTGNKLGCWLPTTGRLTARPHRSKCPLRSHGLLPQRRGVTRLSYWTWVRRLLPRWSMCNGTETLTWTEFQQAKRSFSLAPCSRQAQTIATSAFRWTSVVTSTVESQEVV